MHIESIVSAAIDTAFKIHVKLGPGLFESVYESILFYELCKKDLLVVRQVAIPVVWEGQKLELGFRADLILDNKVLIEIKSIESIHNVHKKQVLTYLKLTGVRIGLLMNFNEALFKNGITRIINGY